MNYELRMRGVQSIIGLMGICSTYFASVAWPNGIMTCYAGMVSCHIVESCTAPWRITWALRRVSVIAWLIVWHSATCCKGMFGGLVFLQRFAKWHAQRAYRGLDLWGS